MRKKRIIFLILMMSILFVSCTVQSNGMLEEENYIYYLNNSETKVVRERYEPISKDTKTLIWEYFDVLKQEPSDFSYRSVLPKEVKVEAIDYEETGQLTVYFNSEYSNLKGIREILSRAAIVKTLCQIENVNFVQFYVDRQPLLGAYEKPIGFMTGEDFIDNTGGETNYYQNADMILFFADESGEQLLETHVSKRYDGTIPMEQLIVEQLIKGPNSIEGIKKNTYYPTIPEGTQVLKTTTKDSVCYIDFNEKFLEKADGITDEVALYSVVNSLVELSSITKVQFSINGIQQKTYCELTEFDRMFERNLDLVKQN